MSIQDVENVFMLDDEEVEMRDLEAELQHEADGLEDANISE